MPRRPHAGITIAKIAGACNVSLATVTRSAKEFSRKLRATDMFPRKFHDREKSFYFRHSVPE